MQKHVTILVTSLSLLGLVALWSFGGSPTASVPKEQQTSEESRNSPFVLTGFSASGVKISVPVSNNITSNDNQVSVTNLRIGGP